MQPYAAASVVASEPFEEDDVGAAAGAVVASVGAGAGASGSRASGGATATGAATAAAAGGAAVDKKSEQAMVLRVHDPEKHGEGSYDAHVTYAITTQTSLSSYAAPRCTSRRRYQDFVWLRSQLVREFPAYIVPPLPLKHRMGT